MTMIPIESPLLPVAEAAALLNCSARHIYTLINRGELRHTRIGKYSVRVYRDEIEAIIQQGMPNALAQ